MGPGRTQILSTGFAGVAMLALAVAVLGQGCGSSACDSSKCAADNACITEVDPTTKASETQCRRLCQSLSDPNTGCPANYTCSPDANGTTYCAANTLTYPPGVGQWGASCNPSKGLDKNADCDFADTFACYGSSPTDGNAYCTQFDCTDDRQCGAGFYCGTVNRFPNVQTTQRVIANTVRVCLKREYCAPCRTDIDCLPVNDVPSHCVAGTDGAALCAPECTADSGCNSEAYCAALTGLTPKVCFPRAGKCVGDGGLCAPCRSDGDCLKDGVQGACVRGEFNTEQSCAVPSKKPCFDATGTQVAGACAGLTSEAPSPSQVGCYGGVAFKEIPPNYCQGVVPFSSSFTSGCYSPKR